MCDLCDAGVVRDDGATVVVVVTDVVFAGWRRTRALGAAAGAGTCAFWPCADVAAVQFVAGDQLIVGVRRICSEPCALGVCLWCVADVSIYARTAVSTGEGGGRVGERRVRRARKAGATHRMHALVAPSVWRAKVALAFNRLATAEPERLVLAVAAAAANPLDLGALVVVRHVARPVAVLDIGVVGVAPDTVKKWRRLERREEGG